MKDLRKADKWLMLIIIIFSIFGLIMIFSSSSVSTILRYDYSSAYFFWHQLITLIAGYIVAVVILLTPTRRWKLLAYIGAIGIVLALFYVLIYGHISGNARSWFRVGPISIQPAEFAKSIAILAMAYYYNNIAKVKKNLFNLYYIPLALAVIIAILIFKQPDKGGALIFLMLVGLTFLSVPRVINNFWQVFKTGVVIALIVGIGVVMNWKTIFSGEAGNRLDFQNPCEKYYEDEGSGYQVCNGFIAISNGGLFGVGLGKSSQKYMYLPDSHTDFIFPIICEELGLITGIIVILGYLFMLYRINIIAKEADNVRNRTIAFGTFWYFAIHIIINLFGVLGLMPLTGIPLPFLSYGGSYTLNALILIAFVIRISIENKTAKFQKELASL